MFVRSSGVGLSALSRQLNIPAGLRSHIPEGVRKDPSDLVSDSDYHWVVLPPVLASAAHRSFPHLLRGKKKKIKVAIYRHAGEAMRPEKEWTFLLREVSEFHQVTEHAVRRDISVVWHTERFAQLFVRPLPGLVERPAWDVRVAVAGGRNGARQTPGAPAWSSVIVGTAAPFRHAVRVPRLPEDRIEEPGLSC